MKMVESGSIGNWDIIGSFSSDIKLRFGLGVITGLAAMSSAMRLAARDSTTSSSLSSKAGGTPRDANMVWNESEPTTAGSALLRNHRNSFIGRYLGFIVLGFGIKCVINSTDIFTE
jgi:hypothetical protein